MAPFEWTGLTLIVVNLALGFGFGFVLERAGFGDSRKLAAQFYLTDLTVLKVMFGAIVTAMLLLLWAGALGWVEIDRVVVSPTFLTSGIIGGLLLGIGFIVGGYCPGTSLVAFANLKIDALLFVAGLVFGIVVFGETVPMFWEFFQTAGARGVYTLDQWLGVSKGMAAVLVTFIAVFAFWGAELLETTVERRRSRRVSGGKS